MNRQERNKRLGQYFTSLEVAKLLTEMALSIKPDISSSIDPMMGKGIFIQAIKGIAPNISCHGIELDITLAKSVKKEFEKNATLIFGNSFDPKIINQLDEQFDLVITNPPYVRHLNQAKETLLEKGVRAPSGSQVRTDLLQSLESNSKLSEDERSELMESTKNYSGLSDLSVPSIIQCISLTKTDGILALLIPESCLSREYSITTLNVLFKFFDIKVIVKDEGRNWFDNAQIKTLLIVARKLKKPRKDIFAHSDIPVIEIANSDSDNPLGRRSKSYKEFASSICESPTAFTSTESKYYRSIKSFIVNILSKNNVKTFPKLKKLYSHKSQIDSLDPRLAALTNCREYTRLDTMAIDVHQGLRTGANKFFYCDLVEEGKDQSLVSFEIKGETNKVHVPNRVIRPVLRKQKEVSSQKLIASKNLKGRLIDLKNSYTLSDITKYDLGEHAEKLPKSFSDHIDYCSDLNIGTSENPKYFPQLSAVKTNISTNNGTVKTWYQLPALKDRHLPDICIPRVNSSIAKPLIVEKGVVVDANFITINASTDSYINKYGVLALLSADWTIVQLELSGNTLGGGALKLDRTHLQNLVYSNDIISYKDQLEKLGQSLIESPEDEQVLIDINNTVNTASQIIDSDKLKTFLKYKLKLRNNNA